MDFPSGGLSLTFWRVSLETMTRRRNPLFGFRTGTTPQSCAADELHAVHLGELVSNSFWRLILANIWDAPGTSAEDRHVCAIHLHTELFSWHRQQRPQSPGKPVYVVHDFSLAMLGSPERPVLRAKAAQSGSTLPFAMHMVGRFVDRLDHGEELLSAGRTLEQYMEIPRSTGLRLSHDDLQRLLDSALALSIVRAAAGISYKPKVHLFVRLVQSAGHLGNPRLLGSWIDEIVNMRLASICRTAHAAFWSQRILATFSHDLGPTAKAVRKRTKT